MTERTVPLFAHWTGFVGWLLPRTGRFPRSARFSFAARIDAIALDVLEAIIEAQYTGGEDKRDALRRATLGIDKLRVLIRLSCELGHLAPRRYEYASEQLVTAGRMAGGWLRHQEQAVST